MMQIIGDPLRWVTERAAAHPGGHWRCCCACSVVVVVVVVAIVVVVGW
jgi:hypothetical protein